MALPTVTIVGNTTGPAELRFTPSGKAVANLTVVANKRGKNDRGEWEDRGRSPFIRVAVWGEDAEAVAEAISADGATPVIVTGQLLAREYTDRDGNKRESIELDYATVGVIPRQPRAQRQHAPKQGQPAADPWATPPQGDPWATPSANDAPPF